MSFFSKLAGYFKAGTVQSGGASKNKNGKEVFNALELTEEEAGFCNDALIPLEDALFLKKLTNRSIERLIFQSEYSDIEKPSAICSLTSEEQAKKIVRANREKFMQAGKTIFICEMIFTGANSGYKVALVATPDPYQAMEYMETNGINFDIETKDIIARYKKWDNEFGIKHLSIGFDFCECEIVNTKINYKQLADEVYEFCPDVVEQGTETVERLEEEIKRTGSVYLWWD